MKVLDLGSGAGDVALLLAELVGPQGRVIGVATNTDILDTARLRVQAAGWTTVDFQRGDIQHLDLDDDFDVVVGRWVLMYQHDPVDLLRKTRVYPRPSNCLSSVTAAESRYCFKVDRVTTSGTV